MDLGIGGIADAVELKSANGIDTYEAHHSQLGRVVIVKLLPVAARSLIADDMDAFSDVLKGPGVVPVHDFGETAHGRPYLITELCEESLLDRLADRGPMGPFRACAVLAEVADAVFFAHERGVVHGNIRPSNIMSDDGAFFLTDFGAAGARGFDGEDPVPSWSYVAPEDLDEKNPVHRGSDVYGLGATLFHLVTGRAPFLDQPASALSRKIPNLRDSALPDEVCEVIESAMAGSPRRRPSAGELRQLLQRAARAGGQKVGAARYSNAPPRSGRADDRLRDDIDHDFDDEDDDFEHGVAPEPIDESPLGPNAVPVRGTAAQVRELRSVSTTKEKLDNSWATSALAVALFVGAIAILFFGLRAGSSDSAGSSEDSSGTQIEDRTTSSVASSDVATEDVVMPDVRGASETEAIAELRALGIQVSLSFEPGDAANQGAVVRTEPEAGGVVVAGSSAAVFVSTGPNSQDCALSVVPDVVGQAVAPARDKARSLGFRVALAQQPNEDVATGNVVSASLPAGECVAEGTPLTLVISCESVIIPELEDFSPNELQAAGVKLVSRSVISNTISPGSLVSTNPPGGTPVCKGHTVVASLAEPGNCPQVPAAEGKSESEASAAMDALGYSVDVRYVDAPSAQPGAVVGSTPTPGTPLCAGGVVTIDVANNSAGAGTTVTTRLANDNTSSAEVSVPYVFYLDVADAERILKDSGLVPQVSEFQSIYDGHPFVGTVQATKPGPQSKAPIGSTVDLVVWCAEPC